MLVYQKKWFWNKLADGWFACFLQRCAIDEDDPSLSGTNSFIATDESQQITGHTQTFLSGSETCIKVDNNGKEINNATLDKEVEVKKKVEASVFDFSKRLSCKWSTGAGPRIGCVRDYPEHLQIRALEQVNLSPRPASARPYNYGPIPSPRPSPKVRMSPRLAYMGLPSPRTSTTAAS